MTSILELLMWYKLSESYYVFDKEYHEYIKNVQH